MIIPLTTKDMVDMVDMMDMVDMTQPCSSPPDAMATGSRSYTNKVRLRGLDYKGGS